MLFHLGVACVSQNMPQKQWDPRPTASQLPLGPCLRPYCSQAVSQSVIEVIYCHQCCTLFLPNNCTKFCAAFFFSECVCVCVYVDSGWPRVLTVSCAGCVCNLWTRRPSFDCYCCCLFAVGVVATAIVDFLCILYIILLYIWVYTHTYMYTFFLNYMYIKSFWINNCFL